MAIFTFKTEEAKELFGKRVKHLWRLIATEAKQKTWVQVEENSRWEGKSTSGTYRNRYVHGFLYKFEWPFLRRNPHIDHVIKLRIGRYATDESIAYVLAHEFGHLLQYHNGRRPKTKQREVHADKWAKYRLEKIQHKLENMDRKPVGD